MNPFRTIRILTRAQRVFGLIQTATASYERTHDVSKSLFVSKTFWFNIVTAAVELSGVLPLPPGTVGAIAAIGNVVLRLLTTQPAHVIPPQ